MAKKKSKEAALVYNLTICGERELPKKQLDILTSQCRHNPDCIVAVGHAVLKRLAWDHSQVRFAAFLILERLFEKSHVFRQIIADNFQKVLLSTLNVDPQNCPLPPPQAWAEDLDVRARAKILQWNNKYGGVLPKIPLGLDYLKKCKKVDLAAADNRETYEQTLRNQMETKKRLLTESRIKKALEEMSDDLDRCFTEMKNCLRLLLPGFDLDCDISTASPPAPQNLIPEKLSGTSGVLADKSGQKDDLDKQLINNGEDVDVDDDDDDRAHGVCQYSGGQTVELRLDLSTIPVLAITDDNRAVYETLRDNHRLLTGRYGPSISRKLESLSGVHGEESLVKRLIDLKQKIKSVSLRFEELNVQEDRKGGKTILLNSDHFPENELDHQAGGFGNYDDDSDFEDVPEKEGMEWGDVVAPVDDSVPDYILRKSKSDFSQTIDQNMEWLNSQQHPSTSSRGNDKCSNLDSEPESKPKLLTPRSNSDIPVLSYGLDLKYWGVDKLEPASLACQSTAVDCHRFWRPTSTEDNDGIRTNADIQHYQVREMNFSGEFQPIERQCRAPLLKANNPNNKRGLGGLTNDGQIAMDANGGQLIANPVSLCPRRDRYKCPFHGPIIGRDEFGNPTINDLIDPSSDQHTDKIVIEGHDLESESEGCDSERNVGTVCPLDDSFGSDQSVLPSTSLSSPSLTNNASMNRSKYSADASSETIPDWQDPELLNDIRRETGLDLKVQPKKGKGRLGQRGKAKLINLKHVDGSRSRLEKRVLNKRVLARVGAVLDDMDGRKAEAKFGNNWNYALKS